ncbi:MAG TPA: FAD-dependent oxidoreductase [Candidatus Paceibacterota bacterium]
MISRHDVLIVGGGVTGTALLYVLSRYHPNIKKITLLEKYSGVAQVNSHPLNNAQTSHDGGTETNYSLKHALEVQKAAVLLRAYVEEHAVPGLFKKTHRMVLAVGAKEIQELRERFLEFKPFYPDLRLAEREELADIEPMVVLGRREDEPILGLVSTEGYAINYQKLSESFVENARVFNPNVRVLFDTEVTDLKKTGNWFVLETNRGTHMAPTLVFAAGAYSLLYAQKLGYTMHLGILPVAGNFYSAGRLLRGKVYRPQIKGIPFAAIHGDPDVLNENDTRFGPTTKPLPLMERHRLNTFFDFVRLPIVSLRGLWVLLTILANKNLLWYVCKNVLYDIPLVGTFLFLKEARVIVPTLQYKDLSLRKGAGGTRPQSVDLETGELEMGDKTIVGNGCIFNTTPSPGASVCLANATRDAAIVQQFFQKHVVSKENPPAV